MKVKEAMQAGLLISVPRISGIPHLHQYCLTAIAGSDCGRPPAAGVSDEHAERVLGHAILAFGALKIATTASKCVGGALIPAKMRF